MATSIRCANAADAAALARIGAATFAEAFGALYSAADLADFLQAQHSVEAWARTLADPGHAVWLLERDEAVEGYVLAGPNGLPHPDAMPGDGELKRLYVLSHAQNDGGGRRLFEVALAWLRRHGVRTVWISVWSGNLGAQRFYARHGFVKAGEYEFVVGRQRDHEFIYRSLSVLPGGD